MACGAKSEVIILSNVSVKSLERMEKEAEEERMRKQRAAAERAFQDGITKAKLVMRRAPLGTDRNHNRLVLQISQDLMPT